MYDTIIIGAGMSGLAAGIRLAHFDRRVCILEKHTTIGGLNSFYRLRGRDYDVGLHAVTNVTPKGTKKGPLARLFRQLRMTWDDFAIRPQIGSEVAFPGVRLRFDNDPETLRSEIKRTFPTQTDSFDRLAREIVDYDELNAAQSQVSARKKLDAIFSEPMLVEMLLCPLMFYGSARENDIDWAQFSIMFRSIFLEGLGRPRAGVRQILKHMVKRFRSLGGELKLRTGVRRLRVDNERVTAVELDGGETIEARNILSSAGLPETMRLCGEPEAQNRRCAGQLSFVEAIATLDAEPVTLGHDRTVMFFNDCEKFAWKKPDAPCDLRSGVICSPNNFDYDEPLSDGTIRVTALANFDYWNGLDDKAYRLEKLRWYDRVTESAVRFMPEFRGHVVDTDMFTPTTITRFTGRTNGAVYGAPEKRIDGKTNVKNLFICGADQGFVGIVGSIVSGITMANRWCLRV